MRERKRLRAERSLFPGNRDFTGSHSLSERLVGGGRQNTSGVLLDLSPSVLQPLNLFVSAACLIDLSRIGS